MLSERAKAQKGYNMGTSEERLELIVTATCPLLEASPHMSSL